MTTKMTPKEVELRKQFLYNQYVKRVTHIRQEPATKKQVLSLKARLLKLITKPFRY